MPQSGGSDELPDDLPEDQIPGQTGAEGTRRHTAGSAGSDEQAPAAPNSASAYTKAREQATIAAVAPTAAVAAGGPIPLDYAPASSPLRRASVLIIIAVVGLILWFAQPILVPLAVAVLLSFLLSPLCEFLERRGLPRFASVLLVVIFAFGILGALGWAVFNGTLQLADNIERIGGNLEAKIQNLPFQSDGGRIDRFQESLEKLEDAAGAAAGDEKEVIQPKPATAPATEPATAPAVAPMVEEGQPLSRADEMLLSMQKAYQAMLERQQADDQAALQSQREAEEAAARAATQPARGEVADAPVYVTEVPRELTAWERATYVLGLVAGPLGAAGLIIIFTLFILIQRDDLRDRVITLAAGQQLNLATQALDDATTRISKYLIAQAIVNGSYGLAIGVGLELMALGLVNEHFPSVWLWALLCATLRFIPYLGPWIAAMFPIIVSIGWWPGYEMFLATAGYIVIIELLSNNIMEPMLYGSSTGMSPVAIILAAAFWTFVWGPIGLLVATPLTTCLVVLGKYVPGLRFFDILLGDEPVLPPQSRLYQRMLALDAEDAEDVVEEYRKEHTLTATFDEVLLPALAMAERDRHAGHLTVQRIDFIRVAMREIVEELGRQTDPIPSDSVDLASTDEAAQIAAAASAASAAPAVSWAPEVKPRVVVIPSVDAADKTAACMLEALLTRRGFEVSVLDDEELTSEKLEQVFQRQADVAVISAVPPRAVSRARYLVKRLRQAQAQRGQDTAGTAAATIVGLWTVRYDTERAANRVSGEGPDVRVVTSLAQAVEEVRQRAQVVSTRRAAEPAPEAQQAPPPRAAPAGI